MLQSHSNENSVILIQGQTDRSMEQNRELNVIGILIGN